MNIKIWTFMILAVAFSVSFAQETVTTKDGKTIVLKPDGTWQYSTNLSANTYQGTSPNPPFRKSDKSETISGDIEKACNSAKDTHGIDVLHLFAEGSKNATASNIYKCFANPSEHRSVSYTEAEFFDYLKKTGWTQRVDDSLGFRLIILNYKPKNLELNVYPGIGWLLEQY